MSNNKNKQKHKTQTGGLQEKKIKVEPTKEEIKQEIKEDKIKRKEKRKERKKDKVKFTQKIRDLFAELKRVKWPTLPHALKQTGVVLGMVLVFSVILFGINYGLAELFNLLTKGL